MPGRHLVPGLLLLLASATASMAADRPLLRLQGPLEVLGCQGVEGRFVAFLVPRVGSVVLSAAPFPGGLEVGRVAGGEARIELPGLGARRLLAGVGGSEAALWGLVDRSFEVGDHSGCVGFDKDRFTWQSDLETYLHWILAEVVLPLATASPERPPAVRIAERRVRLAIESPGHAATLEGVEGGLLGYGRVTDPVRYLFQPIVVDEGRGELLVRVLSNRGSAFGEGSTHEIAVVRPAFDAPARTATDPPFEIRVLAIEP